MAIVFSKRYCFESRSIFSLYDVGSLFTTPPYYGKFFICVTISVGKIVSKSSNRSLH